MTDKTTGKSIYRFSLRHVLRNAAAVFLTAAVLMILGAFPGLAHGWENLGFEAGHISTVYNMRNGLPFSEINAIAQTEDGYIYFGGYGGLVQYDGRDFHKFSQISSCICLYPDPDGSLWIGTNDMGLVHMTAQSEFTYYGTGAGLRTLSVRAIQPDGRGTLYFATTSGIFYTMDGKKLTPLDDSRLNDLYIATLSPEQDGIIYGTTVDGDVFLIRDHKVEQFRTAGDMGRGITCVCPDPGGNGIVYFGTEADCILHGKFSAPAAVLDKIVTPGIAGINDLSLIDGIVWICSNKGIARISPDEGCQVLSLTPLSVVGGVIKDYEGNLWFNSNRNGVLKVCKSIFTDVSLITDMKDRVVTTTWMKDELLYVGTDTGLLVFSSDGRQVRTPVSDLLKEARIRVIKEDSRGDLWFCTSSEHGLVCLHPNGDYHRFNRYNGLVTDYTRTIMELEDGTMVVSVNGGIQFIRDGEIKRTFEKTEGLPNNVTLSICEARDGTIYLGSNGNGIHLIDGDRIRPFEGENDLSSSIILRIIRDDSRDCLWIVTSKSVGVMKDGAIRELKNLPLNGQTSGCYDIFLAENGKVWMMGGTGAYVADGDDLLSGEEAPGIFYTLKNGLPHICTANSRSYVSPEGMAYVAGLDGITGVNINDTYQEMGRVKLAIPYIEADGKRIYTVPGQSITLPSNTRRITIYSYVLSYDMDDPTVSLELEGFGEQATYTTKEELYPRTYTNLPGGSYVFRIQARDDETGEAYGSLLRIVKAKAFYELPGFWAMMGLFFFLAIALIIHRMLKSQERRLEKKREDERISSELRMASDIQQEALPRTFPAFPDRTDFDIYATMVPAREVGGDFYDFFLVDDDHLCMVIADVSDKGVPAALYMMAARISINDFAMMGKTPAEVLTAVNEVLTRNQESEMFVTVWIGILDLRTGVLTAGNAGHEYPILKQPEGDFEVVKDRHGMVLGGMEGIRYRQYELVLQPGAKLFLYTDGVPEASNMSQKFYGIDRTLEALNSVKEGSPEEILRGVKESVSEYVGSAPQFDDMTMMCLHYIYSRGE